TASNEGPDSRRWWALGAVSLATFMTYLDNNIVNVAIPTIQRNLNLSVSGLEWVVSSYLLTVAGLLLVGGRLADVFGRRRLFLADVPVALITFAIAIFYVTESRSESAVRQLDLPGLATCALSLFALTYALIEGNVSGWTAPRILGAFALAAVSAGIFLAIESRTANPMVDLKMFRSREFSGGSGTMMIWAFGVLGIYFFTSLYLQQTLGFSPVEAGLAFVPMALCVAVFAGIAPRI